MQEQTYYSLEKKKNVQLALATLKKHYTFLNSIIKFGVKIFDLEKNPCSNAGTFKENKNKTKLTVLERDDFYTMTELISFFVTA